MTEKVYPKIIVVDENNENPRAETYTDAVANGWMRRAARVYVVNESMQVLIQRRSEFISSPLLLDNSSAGHVDEGEEYSDAALRELHEELGVRAQESSLIQLLSYKEPNFFAENFLLRVPDDIKITIDPHEVAEYFWYTRDEVDEIVTQTPELCAGGLLHSWPYVRDKILAA